MPAAVKLQAQYGDELQVIFVHSQGGTDQDIVRRQLERKWLGTNAMWTNEAPFRTSGRGLPSFALLDASGAVVMHGSSGAMMSQMKDKVAELVKSSSEAPEDMPKPVQKAYEAMQEREYSKALAILDKQIAKPSGGDANVAKVATELRGQLMERASSHIQRIRWMAENGYPEMAADALKGFMKVAKSVEDVQGDVNSLKELMASKEMKAELAAAGDLNKLEKKLFEDPKGKHSKSLAKFMEKHGSTTVAKRAEFWTDKVFE